MNVLDRREDRRTERREPMADLTDPVGLRERIRSWVGDAGRERVSESTSLTLTSRSPSFSDVNLGT